MINNSGTLEAASGATLQIGPNQINNAGNIQINGTLSVSDFGTPGSTFMLHDGSSAGTLTLSSGEIVTVITKSSSVGGETFENNGNTITSTGNSQIGDGTDNYLTLDNASGAIKATAGTLTLDTGNTITNAATLEVTSGAVLQIDDAVGGTGTLLFAGAGTVALAQSASFSNTVSGFGTGDVLDLRDLSYQTSEAAVWTQGSGGGALAIYSGTTPTLQETLTFAGTYAADNFALTNDGANHPEVIWSPAQVALAGLDSNNNAIAGQAVTTSVTAINGGDSVSNLNYTWVLNGTIVQNGTSNSFTPTGAEDGEKLIVVATFTDALSSATDQVTALAGTVLSLDSWTGTAGDGQWSTAGNWSNGLPTSSDAVQILPSSTATITLSSSVSVGDISTNADATLTLTGSGTVLSLADPDESTFAGPVNLGTGSEISIATGATLVLSAATLAGGTIANSGLLDVIGTSTLENGATVNGGTIDDTGTLAISGTVTLEGGATVNGGGALSIVGGATLDIENSVAGTMTLADVSVTNSGILQVDPLAAYTVTLLLDEGTTLSGGTLLIHVTGSTSEGVVDIGAGGATFAGVNVTDNHSLVILSGDTLELGGITTISGTGGSITDSGTFEVTGGTVDVTSAIAFNGTGSIEITGGTAEFQDIISQSVLFSGAGTLELSQATYGGTITGFGTGDALELSNQTYSPTESVTFSGSTLTVNGETLTLSGSYSSANFALEEDASGTTLIAYVGTSVPIFQGATYELSGSSSENVSFDGSSGTFIIDNPATFSGMVSGISGSGDVLDLRDLSADSSDSFIVNAALSGGNTILTVTDTTQGTSQSVTLIGDYTSDNSISWLGPVYDGHGGATVVDPPATAATIVGGGSFELNSPSNESVTFTGSTGSLILNDPENFTGQIVGFTGTAPDAAHSDTIDLVGINYDSSQFAETYNSSNGLLSVTDGTHSASLTFDNFNATLDFASDGNGGTLITDPPAAAAPSEPSVLSTAAAGGASGTLSFADHDPADAITASVTPDGTNYVGNFSLEQPTASNGTVSVGFDFMASNDQINLTPGETLTQSYSVGVADAQNPAQNVNQTVSVTIGGPGNDNFVFAPGIGADTITNFNPQQDTLELDHFAAAQTAQELQALITTDVHGDAVINLGHNDSITLAGVTTPQLQQAIQAGHVLLH